MMRLTDIWFEATFYREVEGGLRHGVPFAEAQGLFMYCPCGYSKGESRAHHLLVPFRNPPSGVALSADHGPTARGNPSVRPRWTMTGTSIEDLSLAPSIDVGEPSCWHGYITNGHIT